MKNRISVNVKRIERMPNGKLKVKIVENSANLTDMRHNGEDYVVVSNLGRGRYIMKKL